MAHHVWGIPRDVLKLVFALVDVQTLGRLSQCCKFFFEIVRKDEAARRCMRLGCFVTLPGRRATSYKYMSQENRLNVDFWLSLRRHESLRSGRGLVVERIPQKIGHFGRVGSGASGAEVRSSADDSVLGLANGWFLIHRGSSRGGAMTADVTLEKKGKRFVIPVLRDFDCCTRPHFAMELLENMAWTEGCVVLVRGNAHGAVVFVGDMDKPSAKVANITFFDFEFFFHLGVNNLCGCGKYLFVVGASKDAMALVTRRIDVDSGAMHQIMLLDPYFWNNKLSRASRVLVMEHETRPNCFWLCVAFLASSDSLTRCWIVEEDRLESTCVGEVPYYMYGGSAVLTRVIDEGHIRSRQLQKSAAAPKGGRAPQYFVLGDTNRGDLLLVDVANTGERSCISIEAKAGSRDFIMIAPRREISSPLPMLRLVGYAIQNECRARVPEIVSRGDLAVVVVDCCLWICELSSFRFLYRLDAITTGPVDDSDISILCVTEEIILAVAGDELIVVRFDCDAGKLPVLAKARKKQRR